MMGQWINKAFASREDLRTWNEALDGLRRGTFSPLVLEMISDAERENAEREPFVRWDSRDDHHTDYLEPYGLKPGEKK